MINAPGRGIFEGKKVAYFTMEIGLLPEFHTYSGGLGVLAGDTVRTCADLKIPLVAVTLVSRMGYFRQGLDGRGRQEEYPDPWNPEGLLRPLREQTEVVIEGRKVVVKAWMHVAAGSTGGEVPVIFLDTHCEENREEDRSITSYLYGGDKPYRMKQEIVLGVAGVRVLRSIGIDVVKYHMNEGHAAFLTLELLQAFNRDVERVRSVCVFTTHTPIEAGHDKFDYPLAERMLPPLIPLDLLKRFTGLDHLNMTLLALNLSGYINGVAKSHGETTKGMFPGYQIRSITNGIHPHQWTHTAFRSLYDKYFPGWASEPWLLVRTQAVPNEEILSAHHAAKSELISYINGLPGPRMSADVLTIGFARRATKYKRHNLIFTDVERLKRINRKYPLQLVFAGKAHPQDEPGKQMIEEFFTRREELRDQVSIVYLENYNMQMAYTLIAGVDVWLNTPQPPMEASGTSGMKAAFNGVVNFSVLDGWWLEGCIEGVTGWAIGPWPDSPLSPEEVRRQEVEDLYAKLEYLILPLFYDGRDRWTELMENCIGKIAYYFNSHRMMLRYTTEAYFS